MQTKMLQILASTFSDLGSAVKATKLLCPFFSLVLHSLFPLEISNVFPLACDSYTWPVRSMILANTNSRQMGFIYMYLYIGRNVRRKEEYPWGLDDRSTRECHKVRELARETRHGIIAPVEYCHGRHKLLVSRIYSSTQILNIYTHI